MTVEHDPLVSAIVAGDDRPADLRPCLRALLDSGDPALELIAVVGASADVAALAASFPAVRLLRAPSAAGASGFEAGLAEATGEYVALVEPDVVVERDWVRELVRFLEAHPESAGAGGKTFRWSVRHPVGDRSASHLSYTTVDPDTCEVRTWCDTPDEVREVATLSGGAVMFRREALQGAGPVALEPELLGAYQETDLCARLLVKGWRLSYTGTPAAWRRVPDGAPSAHHLSRLHRNRTLFAYRNLGPTGLRALLRRQRGRDLIDRLRVRLGPLLPRDMQVEARRESQRWIDGHRSLLERHRAGALHTRGDAWAEAVRRTQARGLVPGRATTPPPAPGGARSTTPTSPR